MKVVDKVTSKGRFSLSRCKVLYLLLVYFPIFVLQDVSVTPSDVVPSVVENPPELTISGLWFVTLLYKLQSM